MYSFSTTVILNLISTRCKSFNELLQHFNGGAGGGDVPVPLVDPTNVRCKNNANTNITIRSHRNTLVLILLRRLCHSFIHLMPIIAKTLPIHLSSTSWSSLLGRIKINNFNAFNFVLSCALLLIGNTMTRTHAH